ncbi:patatin-like phospholipase family protein [Opitutus terrae]|uniref:Uncharacterized protein n=1 Tax=Opitutus terrae (strain DSM 11246 / JCM 15787 / PB90-1) TaxID=452637 RepID=B1ZSW7_OPITP|nr:patatin-like phospholipase family protein [Opitutus terrae]ACB75756.1 conserved hypothetical protein [Opitutus terrae PB90-1]
MPETSPQNPSAYPAGFAAAERALIAERRRRARVSTDAPVVGVALSGGGIRSATFCLGLFQSLARLNLIRRIDVMSTVSGGGYFGSFLGAAFSRDGSTVDSVERELADNHSWSVNWLRENGRFLSPNGAGDNWLAAAVALRNWTALHIVVLTFLFFLLGFGALIRTDLSVSSPTQSGWIAVEHFFWDRQGDLLWWSPWLVLPLIPFLLVMVPTGTVYWATQFCSLMAVVRRLAGTVSRACRTMSDAQFANRAQAALTHGFVVGLASTVALLGFGVIDSLGQTAYARWSQQGFEFPSLWTALTGAGAVAFGFGSRIALYVERLLGARRFRIPFNVVALLLAFAWSLLIVLALSVLACGLAWEWQLVWDGRSFQPMSGGWPLTLAVAICFAASWFFSRSFGFVNLSSLQQTYAARLARAYLGATNPLRQRHANHAMTELIPGDDLALDDYAPHQRGGPLHLVNVTVNETLSGKTQIERRDRKGLAMAVGPCGLSVGTGSHALWVESPAHTSALDRLQALWESRRRTIAPVPVPAGEFHALCDPTPDSPEPQQIEALAVGRWVAISGAAFTTGTGASTDLGLSLLLGLANVRLGYWWDSGITAGRCGTQRPNFLELGSRLLSRLLPVQTCLMNEFFARFHGPARRHWYLSDGGHFENTGCYELIRRRVPLIICSDGGQDPDYRFCDFANLVRKARTDFCAEIQVLRRAADGWTDDPGVQFPLPKLEQIVHPSLLDVIGVPEDFAPLSAEPDGRDRAASRSRCHALLARIHYLDTNEFAWLLLIKPGLMGDEATDVGAYQQTHPLFPQEPTTDQYFDEAQWESYRKLGEHIGVELFTPPAVTDSSGATWTPSSMAPPAAASPAPRPAAPLAELMAQALAARASSPVPFEPMD